MKQAGFVTLAGRPNAGKSTLLNRVLDTKLAIVTPKAQTTRQRLLGIYNSSPGQIVFVDTPGIHRAREGGLNAYMVNEAREAMADTSAIWYLVDPVSGLEHEVTVLDLLSKTHAPVFILINKTDLKTPRTTEGSLVKLETELAQAAAQRGIQVNSIRRISAEKGTGVPELLKDTWPLIPQHPDYFPQDPTEEQLSDRPARFFVAEYVREQLFMQLGEELPYACAVEIESFDEKAKPIRIEATIHVERDSQKGMVIGKGGQKIKAIGTGARAEIENFLGEKVFLGLKVKVLKDWSKDKEALKRMGYAV